MPFCQRVAVFKIRYVDTLAYCCQDHLVKMLVELLSGRAPATEAAVSIYPVVNEEPCEFGVE